VGQLRVRVQARASRTEIGGERSGALLVRVTEAPVEGRANAAVCGLLAKRLGVARGRVSVIRGHAARDKLLQVDGVETPALRRRLGLDG
jgi:uncharacterized protein YggU (UPF0235/DUF167 family)